MKPITPFRRPTFLGFRSLASAGSVPTAAEPRAGGSNLDVSGDYCDPDVLLLKRERSSMTTVTEIVRPACEREKRPGRMSWRRGICASTFLSLTTAVASLASETKASLAPPSVEQVESAPQRHPLDLALERETEGTGPSSTTAAIHLEYLKKWDAELNRAYKLLMAELSPSQQARLRQSQRTWLKSRDDDCLVIDEIYLQGRDYPPTMHLSFHHYAVMNRTRERALLLLHWLEVHQMTRPAGSADSD